MNACNTNTNYTTVHNLRMLGGSIYWLNAICYLARRVMSIVLHNREATKKGGLATFKCILACFRLGTEFSSWSRQLLIDAKRGYLWE